MNAGDSVIDSRDVIERIEELQDIIDTAQTDYEDAIKDWQDDEPIKTDETYQAWINDEPKKEDTSEEEEELAILEKLQDDCNYGDWQYGETLIREDYFEEYTQDLVTDCGYISRDFPSWIEIDWTATTKNVKQDYTEVDFDGETYYIRNC